MKPLILTVCLIFASFSFVQGQIKTEYARTPREQKRPPSIPGDKPGETEELRRFLNENLNLNLVTDTTLKKGRMDIICTIYASGKPKYVMDEGVETYDSNRTRIVTYDHKTKIGREFLRVLNRIPQWNPAEYLKDGSWIKKELTFFIGIEIPYKPDNPDGIMFRYIMEWGEGR